MWIFPFYWLISILPHISTIDLESIAVILFPLSFYGFTITLIVFFSKSLIAENEPDSKQQVKDLKKQIKKANSPPRIRRHPFRYTGVDDSWCIICPLLITIVPMIVFIYGELLCCRSEFFSWYSSPWGWILIICGVLVWFAYAIPILIQYSMKQFAEARFYKMPKIKVVSPQDNREGNLLKWFKKKLPDETEFTLQSFTEAIMRAEQQSEANLREKLQYLAKMKGIDCSDFPYTKQSGKKSP